MGYPSEAKYENDGGPSVAEIAAFVRNVTQDPIDDIAQLRDWLLFNYLAGNSDGHAKNIALVYPETGAVPRLAPMYDLVAIEFLNRLGMPFDRKMAFVIGEHQLPEEITRSDWLALAKSIGVPPRSLLTRLKEMAEALPEIARTTRTSFASAFGDNQAYGKLEESVADRCGWTIRSVFGPRG
jgi:serine/threonine-protein kinase HipA